MANGYVRQSSGSIVNGEIIDAADLNNEYNAIAAAFHDTAGHNHDGTTGNGGPIDLNNSVSGELPISSGGTGADNAGDARDNLGLGSISVQDADDVLISGGLIDDTVIGSVVPNTGKFTTLQTTGAATFGASSSVTGNFSVLGGNVQLDNSRGISFKDTGGTYRSVLIYTNANNTILSNNASTGGVIIENNNSTGAIGFATNSTRRINIFSDGKIAVGSEVSSATAALDLTGDAIKVQNTKAPNSNKVSRFMGVDYSGSYPFIGVWMASTVSANVLNIGGAGLGSGGANIYSGATVVQTFITNGLTNQGQNLKVVTNNTGTAFGGINPQYDVEVGGTTSPVLGVRSSDSNSSRILLRATESSVEVDTAYSNTSVPLLFKVDGVTKITIGTSSGLVGIGRAPIAGIALSVYGTNHDKLSFTQSDNNSGQRTNITFCRADGVTRNSVISAYDQGNLSFEVGGASRLDISPTGVVGVGTSTPLSTVALHINGSNGRLLLSSSQTTSSNKTAQIFGYGYDNSIKTMLYGNFSNAVNTVAIGGGLSAGNPASSIQFWTGDYSDTGTGTVRGRIDNSGKFVIGPSIADSSAILDVQSTTLGFLPPRMTTTQRNDISSPSAGLIIYNITTGTVQFYNGSVWGDI